MLTAALLGFLLGLRHASDPDHLVAVSTIVARHRSGCAASWIGVAWGVGHSVTILAVGGAVVALGLVVPARLGLGLELLVGIVLVALGLANLRVARTPREPELDVGPQSEHRGLATRALAVGLLHGLAGSAAVALLALAAMPTPAAALAYLAVFSLGTVAGMVTLSLGVGLPMAAAASARPSAQRWLVAGSGALSLGVGLWTVWQIGFVQGLLL